MDTGDKAKSASLDVEWDPGRRIASLRCKARAVLNASDAVVLVDALSAWAGTSGAFALWVDVAGLAGTDGEFRAAMRTFLGVCKERVYVAVLNPSPLIHATAEMFRIGTGVQVRGFPSEAEARAWLRSRGISA